MNNKEEYLHVAECESLHNTIINITNSKKILALKAVFSFYFYVV